MTSKKRPENRAGSQPTGKKRKGSRGRPRLMAVVAAGGGGSAMVSGGAGTVSLHLFGTAAGVAVIAWGSAILFVALWVTLVLTWAYIFGDDTRSGRVSRLLDRFPGFQEPPIPQPAGERVRIHDEPEVWTGLASDARLVHSRALNTVEVRRAHARRRSARFRAVPVAPRQRTAHQDRPPRTGMPRRESRPRRLR